MWRCKHCGGIWFHQEKIIDKMTKDGEIEEYTDGDFVCGECGVRGYYIVDIAEWIEEG